MGEGWILGTARMVLWLVGSKTQEHTGTSPAHSTQAKRPQYLGFQPLLCAETPEALLLLSCFLLLGWDYSPWHRWASLSHREEKMCCRWHRRGDPKVPLFIPTSWWGSLGAPDPRGRLHYNAHVHPRSKASPHISTPSAVCLLPASKILSHVLRLAACQLLKLVVGMRCWACHCQGREVKVSRAEIP